MTRTNDSLMAWSLAVAVFLQSVGLVLLGRLAVGEAVQSLLIGTGIAAAAYAAWRIRFRLNHRIDMILVMGAFGGLGMLAGWWIDLGFQAPPPDASFHQAMGCGMAEEEEPGKKHACCAPKDLDGAGESASFPVRPLFILRAMLDRVGLGMAISWMTFLMLLGAIPPGLFTTRCADLAREGARRWISTHIVGNLLMIVGMIYVGHQLGPAVAAMVGSSVVGGHLAMLGGMLLGMEVGMFGGEALFGLKPWREFTWQSEA
jgi:hypothetical protein